ncbi:hypothetical protein PshuTeo2_36060 [Pseudomonas hunanensis]|uniref:phage tailspike polysaccharide lyase family protein n=1 Tax=Pseudomonas hunanensis TaxID=1247546 RepID=UPI002AA0B425|nr:hypothetical protein [Pseudomonas hunanensis]MDY7073476.1 hypothetical protein [Pseudomonas hunanensis]HDS0956547.1 hypothetical protein [Pseudomonas putida]
MRYNTGNPVGTDGSSDPRDLYDNASIIDLLLTGPLGEYLNRLGVALKSWVGIMQQVTDYLIAQGYESVYLTYGAGVVVERQTQLVQRDGELYRVMNASEIPLTLTGTWSTDAPKLQAVGDAALRQALASGAGASMVGWRMRTIADRLNDTANVKDYGAIADGTLHPLSEQFASLAAAQAVYPHATALTDSTDWAAFQAALNSGTPRIHLPAGHYVFNKGNSRNTNTMLEGDGFSTVLDYSGSSSGLVISGSLTQIEDISSTAGQGSHILNFGSPPSCSAGSVLGLYNPTDGSWLANRTYYRAGEFCRVHSVSDNVVNLYGQLTSTYLSSDIDVYRLDGVSVSIKGVRAIPSSGSSVAPIKVSLGVNVYCKEFYAPGVGVYTGIEFDRCVNLNVECPTSLNNSPYANDEYGVTISNCHNFYVNGGNTSATRHAVALGGADVVCGFPCRLGQVHDALLENFGPDIGAADTHGNCDKITYDNVICRNGFNMAGRDITIRNSLIYGVLNSTGECIYGSEIYGGTFTIENCRLVSQGDGGAIGYIHITPSSTMRQYMKLIVRNLTLEAPGGAAAKVVSFRGRNMPFACSIVMDGVTCELGSGLAFLYADDDTLSTFPTNYLIVDNVYGPSGMYLIYPTADVASDTVKRREMTQSGYQDVTTTSSQGSAVAGSAASFRYPYSRMPNIRTGVSLPAGGTMTTIGGQAPVVVANTLSNTAIKMGLVAGSGTFNAAISTRLHWESSINDV